MALRLSQAISTLSAAYQHYISTYQPILYATIITVSFFFNFPTFPRQPRFFSAPFYLHRPEAYLQRFRRLSGGPIGVY